MRIAFVVHDYHRAGGQSRYVVELAERFSASHEVHVFANTFAPSNSPGHQIHFHYVPAWRSTALTTVLTFLLPATLRAWGRFDVIHAQGLCSLRCNVITAHICNRAWFRAQQRQRDGVNWKQRLFDRLVSPLETWHYCISLRCGVF